MNGNRSRSHSFFIVVLENQSMEKEIGPKIIERENNLRDKNSHFPNLFSIHFQEIPQERNVPNDKWKGYIQGLNVNLKIINNP